MPKYEFDFIGYEPFYGDIPAVEADNKEHAENRALAYISEFYPELQDVEITESREI
jgi:hypothetical protein